MTQTKTGVRALFVAAKILACCNACSRSRLRRRVIDESGQRFRHAPRRLGFAYHLNAGIIKDRREGSWRRPEYLRWVNEG
jgi:hypothetical protein